jgi:hypothetical protein
MRSCADLSCPPIDCVVFVPRPWTFCVRCSLQKQAKGKKRMKMMGSVNVPQEAFMAVLNLKDGS